jgi:hypothetical protein
VIGTQIGRLLCAAALCVPICARADGEVPRALAVALDYEVLPGCPGAEDFKAMVAGQLGYDPFQADAPDRVLVRIVLHGRGLEGRLEWRDPDGHWAGDKSLPSRSGDCTELARATSFALAVQIQLLALERMPPGDSSTPVAPPPPVPPAAVSPAQVIPQAAAVGETTAPGGRVLAVGAGGAVAFGLSPGAVPLARVFGVLAWPHVSFELGTEIGLPATTRREDGAGFTQQVLLGTAAGCGGEARWSACLLAKAGQLRIAGQDIDVPASPSGPLVQAGIRLALVQPLGRRWSIGARAEGVTNVTRWTVRLDGTPVWAAPRLAASLGFDLALRFP